MTTRELAKRCGCSTTYILACRRIGVIGGEKRRMQVKGRGGSNYEFSWNEDCIDKVLHYRATAKDRAKVGKSKPIHREKRILCERHSRMCILRGVDDACFHCDHRADEVAGIVGETMWLNEDMGATRTSIVRDFVR